jgi:hypothetical protein
VCMSQINGSTSDMQTRIKRKSDVPLIPETSEKPFTFIMPKNKKTKKSKKDDATEDISCSNSFSELNDDDAGNMDAESVISQRFSRKPKIPPIVLESDIKNAKDTYAKIKSWVKGQVHFRTVNDRKMVYTYTIEDFQKVKTKFSELNFEYHTFTPKAELPKKLVLRGIDPSYSTEDIYNDLFEQYSKVKQVHQMKSTKEKNELYNIYLVHFDPTTDLSYVQKLIRYVCLHKISWSSYQKRNQYSMCNRCQRMGHVSRNCNMKPRCMKCAENHESGLCLKPKEEKPKCPNCNKDHTANYKKCEYYQNYVKTITDRRLAKTTPANNAQTVTKFHPTYNMSNGNFVPFNALFSSQQQKSNNKQNNNFYSQPQYNNSFSYQNQIRNLNNQNVNNQNSQILNSQNTPTTSFIAPSNDFDFFKQEVNDLFGLSLVELFSKLKMFIPQYKLITDEVQRKIAMIEFLSSFVYGSK